MVQWLKRADDHRREAQEETMLTGRIDPQGMPISGFLAIGV